MSMKKIAAVCLSALLLGACTQNKPEQESGSAQEPPASVVSTAASSQGGEDSKAAEEPVLQDESDAENSAKAEQPDASLKAVETDSVSEAPTADSVVAEQVAAKTATGKIKVSFESPSIVLGEVLVVYVDGAEAATAKTNLPFQLMQFYKTADGRLMGLLPAAYTTPIGNYSLAITADGQQFSYDIAVQDREFVVQHLTIDEGTAGSTNTADANAEWERLIEPLKLTSDQQKYWEGNFMIPVENYQVTTEFGMIRYTNGSTNAVRHSGIDFAAKQGTQIYAANSGKVQFAGYLQLTGYTIVIEHGFGVKSFHYHMDSVQVNAGDYVTKGDPIGKVGSTGYSTGPHLHYSLLVNNVFINPWTAFEKGIG